MPPRIDSSGIAKPAIPESVMQLYQVAKNSCPPGHLFNLYFEMWKEKGWTPSDDGSAKRTALKNVVMSSETSDDFLRQQAAVFHRQAAIAAGLGQDSLMVVKASSTAPFVTGTGIEHPTENGFSFLSPYGIPYLPGSSVKGVLRKAAETMVRSGKEGFTTETVEILFGTDNQEKGIQDQEKPEFRQGALTFWDVFPIRSQNSTGRLLRVDVMTPHHSEYLQTSDKASTPHDSEKPNPIPFLTIAPGAIFNFVVTCQISRLMDQSLAKEWKKMINIMFNCAFRVLGLGAKTSVGYGAMVNLNSGDGVTSVRENQNSVNIGARSEWVDAALIRLKTPQTGDVLFNKILAMEWKALPEGEEKELALNDIQSRWGEHWNNPGSKGKKAALAIYKRES